MTKEEKRLLLREAMLAGVPKKKLDIKGKGYSARRLLRGGGNTEKKIDEMYENLLAFRNNGGRKTNAPCKEGIEHRVKEQEQEIAALKKRVESLEKVIKQTQETEKNKKKKQTRKVLGIPITQKTDVVGGRKYVRWYGYTKLNGKRRWIYIGKDLCLAETKIKTWLEKEKGGVL